MLEAVHDDRGQDRLSRARLPANRQRPLVALEEAAQVRTDPEASQLLSVLGDLRVGADGVLESRVLRAQPGSDGSDIGYYSSNVSTRELLSSSP